MTYVEEMGKYEKENMGIAMVKVVPGQENSVYCSLKGKEGILDLYNISGEYDFLLTVNAKDFSKLNRLMEDIRGTHHIVKARFFGKLR